MLVYKCVRGVAPPYLAAFCHVSSDHPGCSRLPSANLYQLGYMFRAPGQTSEIGAFPPTVQLCGTVCQLTGGNLTLIYYSLDAFKRQLKTFLFKTLIAHLLSRRKSAFKKNVIIMRPSSLGGAAYCVALCPSVCLSVCLSVRLSVCPSVPLADVLCLQLHRLTSEHPK